jgi:hypothetical protein
MTALELKEACREYTIPYTDNAGPPARALATAQLYMYLHESQQIPLTQHQMNNP